MAATYVRSAGSGSAYDLDTTGCSLMVAGVGWFTTTDQSLSSGTFGGNAVTIETQASHSANSNLRLAIVRLLSPPTGTNTFVPTWSSGSPLYAQVQLVGFSGTHVSTPIADLTIADSGGDVTSSSNSADDLTADDLLLALGHGFGQPATVTTGTERLNQNDGDAVWWAAITNTGTGTVSAALSHSSGKSLLAAMRIAGAESSGISVAWLRA